MNLQELKKQLLADKQKLAVMAVLMVLGLLLWGRLMLKSVPRTAVAEPDNKIAQTTPDNPDRPSAPATRLPVVKIRDFGRVDRDLFAFNPNYYPTLAGSESDGSEGKSSVDPTDEQKQTQDRQAEVLSAARDLKLQTTLLGTRNRAMINGELLEEGQTIQGFELREVESRRVTLVKDDITIVLEM